MVEFSTTQDQGKYALFGKCQMVTGQLRVHMSFALTNVTQCKQRMGQFSGDTSKFAEGFQALTLTFDLTWKDAQTVLPICCTPEEKQNLGSSQGVW